VAEPDYFGTLDLATGKATLFIPRLPAEYAVWMGKIPSLAEVQSRYGVDSCEYTDQLPAQLPRDKRVHVLKGYNTDSGKWSTPASFAAIDTVEADFDVDASTKLYDAAAECRAFKTDAELEVMRYVAALSSEAHCEVMRKCEPGMMEYQLEAIFTGHCYYHGGARMMSYTCICAVGENSATLHYGHAGAPNGRVLEDGDMALLDMGAEYCCYGSDITCSFPVNGIFSDDQRTVYEAVLSAQEAVEAAMGPGVEWSEMHRLAERCILEGLVSAGVLTGDIDAMMAAHIGAIFMPHGLGHMLGIDTHDVGGFPEGRERLTDPGVSKLRMNRALEPRMVVTVEPGLYFVDPLLDAALANPAQSAFINAERLAHFRGKGGVRLEDVVLVTEAGIENFTVVPRKVADVEAVCAGAAWPPPK